MWNGDIRNALLPEKQAPLGARFSPPSTFGRHLAGSGVSSFPTRSHMKAMNGHRDRTERSSPHHRPWSEPRRTSVRVKHSMRKSPYLVSLFFLLAATTLTLLNIYVGGETLLSEAFTR